MSNVKLSPQQQAVVDNQGGTLLVSAAAGSGKTKVLVDRVMDRIRQGKNIHEFLIITFTNAAASELRNKISKALREALAQEPTNHHLQRQLNLVALAQISTVHAFCGGLIRQYGYLLEVPSDYTMLEDVQREEMLSRILEDILEEQYEKKESNFLLLADTLGCGRNDKDLVSVVQSLFEKMLSQPHPEQWLRQQQIRIPEDQPLRENLWGEILLKDARQQLLWLISRYDWAISLMDGDEKLTPKYLPLYRNHKKQLEAMVAALDGPWDQIGECFELDPQRVVVRNHPDRARVDLINEVKTDGKKIIATLKSRFSRTEAELIAEQNRLAPALEALFSLVLTLYRRFSREKRRKNKLDFNDQEHLAISLLLDGQGNPTDVAHTVRQQFAEIMVDEYQDSNRVQELIYTAIAGEGDTNRFLVGDVKQSIYGFRQAQPEMFIEKYNTYKSASQASVGEPRYLVLSNNFRSRPEILEAVNHVFETVMTPELGGLDYNEEQRLYPGLVSYPHDGACHVELDYLSLPKLPDTQEFESTKYQREAQWVANRIVTLLHDRIPVREGEGLRPVEPEDIAILLRSRSAMGDFSRALQRAGLPVHADVSENLFEAPEVQVLLNLLRVLDNPHQDIPLLSVLCSPLFRLSNQQLAQIRLTGKFQRFYDALMACTQPFALEVQQRLTALRTVAGTMSAEALVWYLIYDGGLMTAYSAMDGGETRKNNLLAIYELARTAAGGSYLYLYELVRYLERQEKNGLSGSGSGSGGITLTTIHKSKGLEYPVVFLCDLSRDFNFQENLETVLVDGTFGIGSRMIDRERRLKYSGLGHQAIKVEKQKTLLSEELRVLYVAMTRPKDYLFMTYACGDNSKILKKLLPGVGRPCEPWAGAMAKSLGAWVLLAAMNRIEAGELFEQYGRPQCELLVSQHPWNIRFHTVEEPERLVYRSEQQEVQRKSGTIPVPEQLVQALNYQYPREKATVTPSKLTATELKGRSKDQEAAEETRTAISIPQLKRPDFILEQKGLSPTEKGTAAHLFLQYADFSQLHTTDGVIEELDRQVDGAYLTPQQADAVSPEVITRLFQSPLGQRLQQSQGLIREFKFSMLWEAEAFYDGMEDEQVLLQGVVDAALVEPDGITIVDFKTDRIQPGQANLRAQNYTGQLMTYQKALERIFGLPVRETLLYFLTTGETVSLSQDN